MELYIILVTIVYRYREMMIVDVYISSWFSKLSNRCGFRTPEGGHEKGSRFVVPSLKAFLFSLINKGSDYMIERLLAWISELHRPSVPQEVGCDTKDSTHVMPDVIYSKNYPKTLVARCKSEPIYLYTQTPAIISLYMNRNQMTQCD